MTKIGKKLQDKVEQKRDEALIKAATEFANQLKNASLSEKEKREKMIQYFDKRES
jgi:hypothetical protein